MPAQFYIIIGNSLRPVASADPSGDDLSQKFLSTENPKRIELQFEHQKDDILKFIQLQHKYIADREYELRDIIDLLTKAMASMEAKYAKQSLRHAARSPATTKTVVVFP